MVQAEELIVAIKSEGVGETRQDLEGVEGAMEETADSAGDSADQLEGFSKKFKGAMGAAVAALAVGAAGLLSQVPVVGEAFSGISAVVDSIARKMDEVLRPAISPITDLFFDIAKEIENADGIMGDIIGVVATVVAGFTLLAGILVTIGAAIGPLISGFGALVSVGGTIISVVTSVLGALAGLISLPAVIIAAIVALAAALIFNIGGARDKLEKILGEVWDFFTGLASDLAGWVSSTASDAMSWGAEVAGAFVDEIDTRISGVIEFFTTLASDLVSWASDTANDAFSWGADLISGFLNGVLSFAGDVVDTIEGVINGVIDVINGAISQLPSEVKSELGISEFGNVTVDTSFGNPQASSRVQQERSNQRAIRNRGRPQEGAQIDGRQITESTGRYRSDSGRRRGL